MFIAKPTHLMGMCTQKSDEGISSSIIPVKKGYAEEDVNEMKESRAN
jgi:hypothetical protein